VHPASAHVQVAPAEQLMVQWPAVQSPMLQVSSGPHSMVQFPPGQLAMVCVEPSCRVPTTPMLQ